MKTLLAYLFLPLYIAATVLIFWNFDLPEWAYHSPTSEAIVTALVLIGWGFCGFVGTVVLVIPYFENKDK